MKLLACRLAKSNAVKHKIKSLPFNQFNLSVVVRVLERLIFGYSAKSKTELLIHLTGCSEYFTEKNERFVHFNILRLEQEKY